MVLQQISSFIGNVPGYSVQAFNQVKTKTAVPFHWMGNQIHGLWTNTVGSLVSERIRVLYIDPFSISDALIMGTSIIVAAIVMIIGITTFGKALIAMSVVAGGISILAGWALSRHYIKARLKLEAAVIVQGMIPIVAGATQADPKFREFAAERVKLDHVKFEYVKDIIKGMNQYERDFRRDVGNATLDFNQIKETYVTYITGIYQQLSH